MLFFCQKILNFPISQYISLKFYHFQYDHQEDLNKMADNTMLQILLPDVTQGNVWDNSIKLGILFLLKNIKVSNFLKCYHHGME